MKKGDNVAIVCCSNGMDPSRKVQVEMMKKILENIGLVPVMGDYVYEKNSVFSGSAKERAQSLMDFYKNEEIKAIFDISGGDIANEILPYLDFQVISSSGKEFWGYSDLTTIINAVYTRTGKTSVLYQVRNLVGSDGERQVRNFAGSVMETSLPSDQLTAGKKDCNDAVKGRNEDSLFALDIQSVQGEVLSGIVVGGNIRCLLKLAGTPYWPDMRGKILLLEAWHGKLPQMTAYLSQLKQMGVFEQINGILLGTFTQMEEEKCEPTMEELVKAYVGEKLPIMKTSWIGHGKDSKAIRIGSELLIKQG